MAKDLNSREFKDCLDKGKIKKFAAAVNLAAREMATAEEDFKTASESVKNKNYKWATVQAYYAMFHTARALVYSKGYRERSHYCLIVTIKALFVSEGLLDLSLVEALQTAKTLRENADYDNEFSPASAAALIEKAHTFFNRSKEILLKK